MSKLTLIFGVTTLAFAGASAYMHHEVRTQRERADALEAQVQALQAEPREVAHAPEPPPAAPAIAQNPLSPPIPVPRGPGTRPPEPAIDPAGPFARGNMMAAMERSQKLLADPEYRDAMKSQQKLMLAQMYPDLAKSLHLGPEETDAFLGLLAEHQMKQMDMRPRYRGDGAADDQARREMTQQLVQMQLQNQNEIAQLLGDAKLQEWQDYQSSLGARAQVRQFRSTLETYGTPLRDDQVQPLVDALMAEQRNSVMRPAAPMRGQMRRNNVNPNDYASQLEASAQSLTESNQRLHDTVAPHLSGSQLRAFDEMLNRQVEMQQIQARMMRAQQDAIARDGGSPDGAAAGVAIATGPGFVGSETYFVPAR